MGPYHHGSTHSQVEEQPTVWMVAVNIFKKLSRTADNGWSSGLEVGRGAKNSSTVKSCRVTKRKHVPQAWADPLVQPKQRKRNIRIGTWNVGCLHRSGSLASVTKELVRYKLHFVGVQEDSWRRGHGKSRGYIFVKEKESKIINL
jgi:hypothetical protein